MYKSPDTEAGGRSPYSEIQELINFIWNKNCHRNVINLLQYLFIQSNDEIDCNNHVRIPDLPTKYEM